MLKFLYYLSVMTSLAANILCVATTTFLSVAGTSLAMRGPDGSMARAVDGMFETRRMVFMYFNVGMASIMIACIFGSWMLFSLFQAATTTLVLTFTLYSAYKSQNMVKKIFHFDEAEAVSFDDIIGSFSATKAAPRAAAASPR